MKKSLLLWVDLRSTPTAHTMINLFEQHFSIRVAGQEERRRLKQSDTTPSVICFDFDYPDQGGLEILRQTRRQHPQLPIIMMTEQHSEQLALWALRLRIWDLLVKPMDHQEARQQIRALQEQLSLNCHWEECGISPASTPSIPTEARYYAGNGEERELNPAVSYLEQHYAEKLSEDQLSAMCNMRPYKFSRTFKKVFGVTFQDYLQQKRVDEAARLLQNPNAPILDVAMAVGFHDQSYFTRVFKKRLGLTPKQFRDHNKPEAAPEQDSRQQSLSLFAQDALGQF